MNVVTSLSKLTHENAENEPVDRLLIVKAPKHVY